MSEEKKPFKINLVETPSINKDGKIVKDEKGNKIYRQADAFSFNQILLAIDTSNYDLSSLRILNKIQDRFEGAWKEEKKEVELNFDMVKFLKDFFKDHRSKMRKGVNLSPFLTRTLVSIADQIEEL